MKQNKKILLLTVVSLFAVLKLSLAADWEYYRYSHPAGYSGVFAENARNDGTKSLFIRTDAAYYINEYRWTGSSYTSITLPTAGAALANNSTVQGLAVGGGKNDGKNYVYRNADLHGAPDDDIGRILQYEWTGSDWSEAVVVGTGSISMTDVAVGTFYYTDQTDREHVFGATAAGDVYLYYWDGSEFSRVQVGTAAAGITSIAVGDGYNDNMFPGRDVYAVSLDSGVYRYSWNSLTGWSAEQIYSGAYPMNDIVVYNNPDINNGIGTECLYTACEDGHVYQLKYDPDGSTWVKTDMGNTGSSVKELVVGTGRSDGVERVYARSGNLTEFTYSGGSWVMTPLTTENGFGLHLSIGEMRGTGQTSLFISDPSNLEEYIYDSIPPSPITTLSAEQSSGVGSIDLRWLSPGDDGDTGPIHNDTVVTNGDLNGTNDIGKFRIDYSTYSKVWSTSTYQIDIATVAYPGDTQSYTVDGLLDTVTYYFCLWTSDNVGNWSLASNVSTAPAGALGATYVYSDIKSDTLWSEADSPYVLNRDLTIEEGVTLTIESGVDVLFRGNYKIDCRGIIKANGTSSSGILFDYYITSATAAGDWDSISINGSSAYADMSFCNIRGASKGIQITTSSWASSFSDLTISSCTYGIFGAGEGWTEISAVPYTVSGGTFSFCETGIANGYAEVEGAVFRNNTTGVDKCQGSFTNSLFTGNSAGVISFTDMLSTMEMELTSCSFISNTTGTLNSATINYCSYNNNQLGAAVIMYDLDDFVGNTLTANTTGVMIIAQSAGGDARNFEFHHNNIYGNSSSGLYANAPTGNGSVEAGYNWWGSTIASAIDEGVYDSEDDGTLVFKVNYTPYLLSAYAYKDSPAAVTDLDAQASASGGTVNLSWSAPGDDNGAVINEYSGKYRLKYSENPGYSWTVGDYDLEKSFTGAAGEGESWDISGLTGGNTYYFALWASDSEGNWSSVSNISSAAVKTCTISGYVLDNSSSALANIEVRLTGSSTTTFTTNAAGYFEFTGLLPGNYTVTPVGAYQFEPASMSTGALAGDMENLKFFGTYAPYMIGGEVLSYSGDPVSGATVEMTGIYSGGIYTGSNVIDTCTTLADGSFSFNLHGEGDFTVTASKNYFTFTNNGQLELNNYSARIDTYTIQSIVAPVLNVDQSSLDFGEVKKGETQSRTINISNTGGELLSGTISSDQSWIKPNVSSFENNKSVTVTVQTPDKDGQYGGNITVASNGGTETVQISITATCILVKPSPWDIDSGNSLMFFGSGVVKDKTDIRIYTLGGDLVREIKNKGNSNGELSWDGKNRWGNKVVPGLYLYTYKSPTETGRGKIVIIR